MESLVIEKTRSHLDRGVERDGDDFEIDFVAAHLKRLVVAIASGGAEGARPARQAQNGDGAKRGEHPGSRRRQRCPARAHFRTGHLRGAIGVRLVCDWRRPASQIATSDRRGYLWLQK